MSYKWTYGILLAKSQRKSHRHTNESVGEYLDSLSKCDKEFNSKFTQLLKETKQRFQKEFDEL